MTYTVSWGVDDDQPTGQLTGEVSTVEELDEILDRISQAGQYQMVDVTPVDDAHELPYGLQVGVGHPDRSFVMYIGEPASGYAYDPSLPAWPDKIEFDYGGEPTDYGPEETRLTPEQAREAAREYVRTGQRPTCVRWSR